MHAHGATATLGWNLKKQPSGPEAILDRFFCVHFEPERSIIKYRLTSID